MKKYWYFWLCTPLCLVYVARFLCAELCQNLWTIAAVFLRLANRYEDCFLAYRQAVRLRNGHTYWNLALRWPKKENLLKLPEKSKCSTKMVLLLIELQFQESSHSRNVIVINTGQEPTFPTAFQKEKKKTTRLTCKSSFSSSLRNAI